MDLVKLEDDEMAYNECFCCPYKTQFPFAFIHHISQHGNGEDCKPFICTTAKLEPYFCKQCEFTADTKLELSKHLRLEHGNFVFMVDFFHNVKAEPESEDEMNQHRCVKCDFTTYSDLVYSKHLNEQCPVDQDLICHVCKFRAKSDSGLKLHQTVKHKFPKTALFSCTNCSYQTIRKQYLTKHIIVKHSNFDKVDYFKCEQCEYKTKIKHYLSEHVRRSHNEIIIGEFPCNQCDYIAKRRKALNEHNWRKHSGKFKRNKRFECTHCSYVTAIKSTFDRHVQRKHFDLNINHYFECEQCLYKSKTKTDLKNHVNRRHDAKNGRKCELCAFIAYNLTDLRDHVKYQHDDNNEWIQCEFCDYKGRNKYVLKNHCISKHTIDENINWFICDYCEYRGKIKYHLTQHIKQKHNVT